MVERVKVKGGAEVEVKVIKSRREDIRRKSRRLEEEVTGKKESRERNIEED